jgi:hypothetical protein
MEKVKNLELHSGYKLREMANGVDYISLNDLIGLKEGTSDPPPQLVATLKKLLKSVTNETEIDQYLVQPFGRTKRKSSRSTNPEQKD